MTHLLPPFLKIREKRHRDGKELAHGQTQLEEDSWDLKSSSRIRALKHNIQPLLKNMLSCATQVESLEPPLTRIS